MYDLQKIQKIISDINRYFKELREIGVSSIKDLKISKNFLSASMLIFSIVNRTIDLGNEILTSNNLGTPLTYRDIFNLLYKNKFITKKMLDEISYLIHIRNLIAHEYYRFKESDIFKALKKLPIVLKFIESIKRKIRIKI